MHKNSKRAYKNTQKSCKSFKLDKSNAVRIGKTAVKPYLSIYAAGLVRFASYCGKMYIDHLFPYGGFPLPAPVLGQIPHPAKPIMDPPKCAWEKSLTE